jgi:CRP-like cAMP-binding protein
MSDAADIESLLSGLGFTGDLPSPVRRQLAAIARRCRYGRGSTIFTEGQVDPHAYVVVEGTVALEMSVPERGHVSLMTLGPGELLGWSAILQEGPMTARAVAASDCELIALPAIPLAETCAKDHHLGYQVMRRVAQSLARRLVATRLQLLDLFSRDHAPASTSSRRPT